MTTAVRRLQFCAGHRVWKHEHKCANLHGHNYVAFVHAEAEHLDDLGRVIDFSVLKERIGGWIEQYWDHGFICHREDAEALRAMEAIPNQKTFVMDANPTAENMADYLLRVVGPEQLADTGVRLVRVVLWETENCYAEVTL